MKEGEINELIDKYLAGTATSLEVKQVDDWYASFKKAESLTSQLSSEEQAQMMAAGFQSLLASIKPGP